jgi:hypothetical protein
MLKHSFLDCKSGSTALVCVQRTSSIAKNRITEDIYGDSGLESSNRTNHKILQNHRTVMDEEGEEGGRTME